MCDLNLFYIRQIEEQRLNKAAKAAEEAAHKRIEKTISDQENMLKGLAAAQNRLEAQASSVETCNTDVDKVLAVSASIIFMSHLFVSLHI